MELSGEHLIPAPRARVWEALNDPAALEACIPGVERLEKRSDSEFAATVRAHIGPVNARFQGAVTLSELDPPNGYRISGQGQGGAAGFARGGAEVRLEDAGGGATRLTWRADVRVGGRLAQFGSRLIGRAAKHLAGEFFEALSRRVGDSAAPPAEAPAGAEGKKEAPAATPRTPFRRWFGARRRTAAIVLAAIVLAAAVWAFAG